MSRFIPNNRSKVMFSVGLTQFDTLASTALSTAVDLTGYVISLNASSQGNTLPTPTIDTLFETSIPGTVQASFSMDMYRDDDPTKDIAWTTLPRNTKGAIILSRTGPKTGTSLAAGDIVEIWPIWVVSRTASNLASNTVSTFTVQCAVYQEPREAVTLT